MYHNKREHIAGLPLVLLLLGLVASLFELCACTPRINHSGPPSLQVVKLVDQARTTASSRLAQAGAIDLLLKRSIELNLVSGGVVVLGNYSGILSITARGRLDSGPGAPLLDERTIFDLASLTKVVATAPAVMKLWEEGKITLSDPLARWFPEFRSSRQRKITILQLLTHTSGLEDKQLRPGCSLQTVVRQVAAERFLPAPGSHFEYADINFILLAELVHRVSGKSFDVFCRERIYGPLGMHDTMFLPPKRVADSLAPTAGFNGGVGFYKGVVQDANARLLGGVAGNAGLFSSAFDLSRYARLMLGQGALDGKIILSQRVVAEMTAPHVCGNARVTRGLGWDMDSPFSAPKGTLFSKRSFGHTGYSGSSIWIDPQTNLFVILLTNRLDYRDTALFNKLRRDVSIVAAAQFGKLENASGVSAAAEASRTVLDFMSLDRKKTVVALLHKNQQYPGRHHLKHVRRHYEVATASTFGPASALGRTGARVSDRRHHVQQKHSRQNWRRL